jgi:hypothetical protein
VAGNAPLPTSNEPFCSHCGYALTGLTESSKCPECGRPLVEVLTRTPLLPGRARRYTSATRLFGLPLVQVAIGPHGNERVGRAKAIFAAGDIALGFFAFGNIVAVGIVAAGGALSIGVASLAGIAVGLLALGGVAAGGVACGGVTLGLVALGGVAVGVCALGGLSVGVYAAGGAAAGVHTITPASTDPRAVAAFRSLAPYLGRLWPPGTQMVLAYARVLAYMLIVAAVTGIWIAAGRLASRRRSLG